MDSRGNIYPAHVVEEIKKAAETGAKDMEKLSRELEELSDKDLAELDGMNHAGRRAWYSNRRRKNKRFGGEIRHR